MRKDILVTFLLLASCGLNNGSEPNFKVCKGKETLFGAQPLVLKIRREKCENCKSLENCTTYEGSIQIQTVRRAKDIVMKQLRFPKLTEITGHLLVSLVYGERSLKEIFPNLAVIRGRGLFLGYSLVIYENDGLEEVNLPSLTTILDGGVRIEKNINLCYAETIRWKSIMRTITDDEYSLVLKSNNNDCYDECFYAPGGQRKCTPPAGHGSLTNQYCWAPGNQQNYDCQSFCDMKCGEWGCLKGSGNHQLCCHKECLGGCFTYLNSPRHCYACRHLRMPDGECVERCPFPLYEVDELKCVSSCPQGFLKLESGQDRKCVKACPAGYQKEDRFPWPARGCVKCKVEKCPRVCKTVDKTDKKSETDEKPPIDSLASLAMYKGCTEIDGNLIINIRGSGGGSGIATRLDENLGQIEKVKGYIVIRESASLKSLNFLKNLKEIKPTELPVLRDKGPLTFEPDLYNDRYALVILDNPKLEAMWPFQQNLSISQGGIMVHLNPYLCPSRISPLVNDILKWDKNDSTRSIDISDTTNGNAMACDVHKINLTLEEVKTAPKGKRCAPVCMKVEWDEVFDDYRTVLFYTVSYREAPNRMITEYDDVDACSSESENVWTRVDQLVGTPEVNITIFKKNGTTIKPRKIVKYIPKLKPFTLYAFQVEAVVLKNEGAKSDLVFIQTNESVPSQPVGLEANYISSSELLVKWQLPLFPNGNITKYIVKYDFSTYSPWKQDLDWCIRQVFGNNPGGDKIEEGSTDKTPDGSCKVNITCECDKDKTEVKPEKKAALFAKEFQDQLYKTVFTKDSDDNETPTNSTTVETTITPTTSSNGTNCSNDAQNPLCQPTTAPPSGQTTTTTIKGPTTSAKPASTKSTLPPTKPSSSVTLDVKGSINSVTLTKLKHFQDYAITVCACTRVGCAIGSSCANTKGMTNKKIAADNLAGPLEVTTDNVTREFVLSWLPPKDPNGVVLKYDIEIRVDTNPAVIRCKGGKDVRYVEKVSSGAEGNYSARVRAITPAGNGSWSNTVTFSLINKEKSTNGPVVETDSMPLGTVLGASLAASVVFVLACGFVVWYFARKRYKRYSDEQIPGVLYASVNPEYMTSTDVYIADEWEFPREKIKLVRELGNGSFGMVYEGEAEDISPDVPIRRVAVKTVSENASIRDRVEFLQEASVMKQFCSNHVVRLLGVVSEGQPTLVIMELMEQGDLKNFLRSRRPGEGTLPPPTLQELLQMAGEIADGMAYLAARKYVHRDLAARNCMVNSDFTVKIGDFGMTRDIYETDYYRKGGKGLLPVRWMAPESLKDGVFTSYSDVWSFGVVMWEMATLACQPYPGKSNEEVLKYVVDGGLMEKPEECPERLYEMMTLCWQFSAKARPTFVYLISLLEEDLSEDFRYLSFYHTLPEDQLKGLLSSHYKHKNRAETTDSTTNVESAA